MRNILFKISLIGFLMLVLGVAAAQAQSFTADGNPGDTEYNTVITAFATEETLNYTDINDNPRPEVNPATDVQVTVLPVYGFSAADLIDMSMYVGQIVTNESYVTNEGNADDTYTYTFTGDYTFAGSGTWTVNFRRISDNSLIGTITSVSPVTSESIAISEDAEFGFYHEVIAPIDGAPGNYLVIQTERETTSTPTGEYTGANGFTYAGLGYRTDDTTYSIDTPLLTLSRTSTVDASTEYSGGIHDAVPGSVITYTLTYSNTGNDTAYDVVLIDKVPNNSNLAHLNQTGSTTYINITAPEGTGTWEAYYSTVASPSMDYGDTGDWTLIGTVEPLVSFPGSGLLYINSDGQFSATWVKWEKASIPVDEDDRTLTWGVTIR